eukprot:11156977-Lingulodinium_polyedra.AAC.1
MMRVYVLPGLQSSVMAPEKPRNGGNSRTLMPTRADTTLDRWRSSPQENELCSRIPPSAVAAHLTNLHHMSG